MDVICDQCQSKFRIPDEKIPKGKLAAFPCPKCKNKISIDTREKAGKATMDEVSSEAYDASDKPFDFVEEEGKTALICESENEVLEKIKSALSHMEYHTTDAQSIRDALKKMRYHLYDLIIVNESFDTDDPENNGILMYLERLEMDIRRNIFVALTTNRFRTMDNMMAFNKSVNLIINNKNIDDVGKILSRGITENDLFYRVYKDTLKSMGRI